MQEFPADSAKNTGTTKADDMQIVMNHQINSPEAEREKSRMQSVQQGRQQVCWQQGTAQADQPLSGAVCVACHPYLCQQN